MCEQSTGAWVFRHALSCSNTLGGGRFHLSTGLEAIWEILGQSVHRCGHDFQTFTLAIGAEGQVTASVTAVLRGVERRCRILQFHLDTPAKIIETAHQNPNVGCVFYSCEAKLFIRAWGILTLCPSNSAITADEEALQPLDWKTYPGFLQQRTAHTSQPHARVRRQATNHSNTPVYRVTLSALEWTYLAYQGSRSARYDWDDAGQLSAYWQAMEQAR